MAAKKEVTFVIRARDLTRGVFRRIGQSVRRLRFGLGTTIAGVGLGALARDALNVATSIQGIADRLNTPVEKMQALKVLGEDAGINFESIATVMQRLQRNFGQLESGDTGLLEDFAGLGITLANGRGKNGLELLMMAADGVRKAGKDSATMRANLARIGDSEAVRLVGLLAQGGSGLAANMQRLIGSGAVQSADAIRKAAAEEAELRRSLLIAQRDFASLMVKLLPVLNQNIKALLAIARADTGDAALNGIQKLGESLPVVGGTIAQGAAATRRAGVGSWAYEIGSRVPNVGVSVFEGQQKVETLLRQIRDGVNSGPRLDP